MSIPKDHHYLPEFYFDPWLDDNGQMWSYFFVNGNNLQVRKTVPKSAGKQRHLYSLVGVEEDKASILETVFFRAIDTAAAPVLKKFLQSPQLSLTEKEASAFTVFLMSLVMRTPEVMDYLKTDAPKQLMAELDKATDEYLQIKDKDDPSTPSEWMISTRPLEVANMGMKLIPDLINNSERGQRIISMEWWVEDLSKATHSLLTSDRPITPIQMEVEGSGILTLPISPNRLFIAAENPDAVKTRLKQFRRDTLSVHSNTTVALQAYERVYSTQNTNTPFIKRRLGKGYINKIDKTRKRGDLT